MKYQTHMQAVRNINDQFRYYKTVESLFELDQWSALPVEGAAYRQQVAAHIAAQKAGLFDGEDAKKAADYFKNVNLNEIEDYVEKGLIRSFLFRYRNQTRTPKDLMHQYSMLRADTMNKWKEAREKQDFEVFRPWLEKVFLLKKQRDTCVLIWFCDWTMYLSCHKIKKAERMKKISDIARELKVGVENIYLISSETAYGKDIIDEGNYHKVSGGIFYPILLFFPVRKCFLR